MMNISAPHYIFAGGGTGGHLYPALAVADQLSKIQPQASIVFLCSRRAVDARVLSAYPYEFYPLPAEGFSANPLQAIRFFAMGFKSYGFVKQFLQPLAERCVLVATGGFVSAPAVLAAHALKIPVWLINVDYVPGKANRFLAHFARQIFTQFDQTSRYFGRFANKTVCVGCPVRAEFAHPKPQQAQQTIGLDSQKATLLITGASSGALGINQAMLRLIDKLAAFADRWQVVHLTGQAHYPAIAQVVKTAPIRYFPIDYYDQMADLYAASDLIIGRGGAVSVAEYAAVGKPVICLPYPYHKDQHQLLNVQPLVNAGAAIIVQETVGQPDQTAQRLWKTLEPLLKDDKKRLQMACAARSFCRLDAANHIANAIRL